MNYYFCAPRTTFWRRIFTMTFNYQIPKFLISSAFLYMNFCSVIASTHHSDPTDMYFEGDILIDADERGFLPPGSNMWDKNIPYVLESESRFTKEDIFYIYAAMGGIEKESCVKFVETSEADSKKVDHIYIRRVKGRRCSSYLGRKGGLQLLNLGTVCIHNMYIIQHELMHALGFAHEQSRSDRDDHIEILWGNIKPGAEDQFEKRDTQDLGVPYDFASIMHYKPTDYSIDGKKYTMLPKGDHNSQAWKNKLKDMWRDDLSASDIKQINLAFKCKKQFYYSFY